eukprot:CAMPEP_0114976326 /NCGR_PEP_ID=MMETSP0216-20121206/2606_1 /TAXON_ID=223996 /ORGANISM="Protocruzia adherens, Strain Boccale" /LENGTH=226 /DNA_ID=CAMNT_0002337233 /DNA_START=476 /DNA_END=1157 /DNA_ORIENTATION=-
MCKTIDKINQYISDEKNRQAADQTGFKWHPLKSSNCSKGSSPCPETTDILYGFCHLIGSEVEPTINPVTIQPYNEKQFEVEADQFSELGRISSDATLSKSARASFISIPSEDAVVEFIHTYLKLAKQKKEIVIYGYILLQRFLRKTGWKLRATNWRILTVMAIRTAIKMEGAPSLTYESLSRWYNVFRRSELERLEITFLRLLDYDCVIDLEEFKSVFEFISTNGQ